VQPALGPWLQALGIASRTFADLCIQQGVRQHRQAAGSVAGDRDLPRSPPKSRILRCTQLSAAC
jgi:hypothetical protein